MAHLPQMVIENVSRTQSIVQNVSRGSSAAALRAAAAQAAQSSSSTNTNNMSSRCNLAQFQQALVNAASKFKGLGTWIDKQVRDQTEKLIEKLDIPSMLDRFREFNPLLKALVICAIMVLLYLLTYLTWEAVSFVWPYVMEFIESETGQNFIDNSTRFLETIGTSDAARSFDSVFATAANQSVSEPDSEISCFETPIFDQFTANPSSTHIDFINSFFDWFNTMVHS